MELQKKNHKITIEDAYGRKIEFELWYDADIAEWGELFRSILYWLAFSPENIDELISLEDDFGEKD